MQSPRQTAPEVVSVFFVVAVIGVAVVVSFQLAAPADRDVLGRPPGHATSDKEVIPLRPAEKDATSICHV